MSLPTIQSQKQVYRMWFEFLKMAHMEPALADKLRSSADFYAAWGDVRTEKFDDWWKGHKHLFGETMVRSISSIPNSNNAINITVPLNMPVTKILAEVKRLVEDRQTEQLIEDGKDPSMFKSLHAGFGSFNITQGVEVRGRTLYEIQLMYAFWQDMHKPPVNTEAVSEIVRRFRDRPKARWIPYILQMKPLPDRRGNLRYDEGQLRQVRRYLKKGYDVCQSVAQGEFPGRNSL